MKNLKELIEQYNRQILKFKELSLPAMQAIPPAEPQKEPDCISGKNDEFAAVNEQYGKNAIEEIDMITPAPAAEADKTAEEEIPEQTAPPFSSGFIQGKTAKGFLRVQAFTGGGAVPIAEAEVAVVQSTPKGNCLFYFLQTGSDGLTNRMELDAPEITYAQYMENIPHACYDVFVRHSQFRPVCIRGVPIYSNIASLLPVHMTPCAFQFQTKECFSVTVPPFSFFGEPEEKSTRRNDGDDA